MFVQEQANFGERAESNLTIDYGLPEGFEVGVNVFSLELTEHATEERPMLLANAAWTTDASEWLRLQLGVQAGARLPGPGRASGAVFAWASMRLRFGDLGDWVVGTYAGNNDYLGVGTPLGLMCGVEVPLVREWLALVAEYISGTSEASVGVVGLVLLLPLGFQISAGLQLPSPLSPNGLAGVLELTRVPTT